MTDTERIKKAIKWLVGTGVASTQGGIGHLMGYTNKSSFSQVVNDSSVRPENFMQRLCLLNEKLNIVWLETGEGEMLKEPTIESTHPPIESASDKMLSIITNQLDRQAAQIEKYEIRIDELLSANKKLQQELVEMNNKLARVLIDNTGKEKHHIQDQDSGEVLRR